MCGKYSGFGEDVPSTEILGLSYFGGTLCDAVRLSRPYLETRTPLAVFTPGATLAARAARDKDFFSLLKQGDLLLPDGCGCRLAARLAGKRLGGRIAGIDFAEALFGAAEEFSARVFLYGAEAGIAERAARHLRAKYPRLIFAAASGYGADPYERISAFCPHIVCVCLGAEKQERWILAHRARVGGILIGLGGSIDVWGEKIRRAPRFLQRVGLEWAYRTLREPRRLPRLFPLPAYFGKCLLSRRWSKCQKKE